MTTFNRAIIPDAIRTNGATPNPIGFRSCLLRGGPTRWSIRFTRALSKTRTAMDSAILRASRRVLIT